MAAPNFDAAKFVSLWDDEIEAREIEVMPAHARFAGEVCRGVRFIGEAPALPVEFGLRVMATLRASHPHWPRADWDKAAPLVGSRAVMEWLWNGEWDAVRQKIVADSQSWRNERAAFALYR